MSVVSLKEDGLTKTVFYILGLTFVLLGVAGVRAKCYCFEYRGITGIVCKREET